MSKTVTMVVPESFVGDLCRAHNGLYLVLEGTDLDGVPVDNPDEVAREIQRALYRCLEGMQYPWWQRARKKVKRWLLVVYICARWPWRIGELRRYLKGVRG